MLSSGLLKVNESATSKLPTSDYEHISVNKIDSGNQKQSKDNFQQSTQYYSYINHESKQSILKDFFVWIFNNTLLALFISLLQPILLILVMICIRPIYQLLGLPYTIFVILAVILPSLYYFHWISSSISSMSYHIDALYTIIPLYLSIIFKDAIFVASGFRYNVKKEKETKYKKLKCPPCKAIMIKYLDKFIADYSIWGTTLKQYIPYGKCIVSRPHRRELNCDQLFAKIFPIIPDKGDKINFDEYYSKSDHNLRYILRILAVMLSVLPTIFFFVYHAKHKEFHYSGVTAGIGMIFLMMVSWSINEYIEIIFYQLTKYYRYMNKLTFLIELLPDQCNHFHVVYDEEPSEVSGISRQARHRKTAEDMPQKQPLIKETILLFDGKGNNSFIWFENWTRVERIACIFFQKRQSIVFALFTTLFACVVCMLYYYINHNIYNTITVSIFGGFLYSSMVLIRLLMFALRISALESRQIELIRLQQTYLKHEIVKSLSKQTPKRSERKEEKNDEYVYYDLDNAIVRYLDDVVMHIKFRSLSPKIAGVKLDTALVRMTISSFAGFITALITYLLSHVKTD